MTDLTLTVRIGDLSDGVDPELVRGDIERVLRSLLRQEPYATVTAELEVPSALTGTFQAVFTPQAWVRDNAIDVDPEGPTSWNCTAMVRRHWEDYFSHDDFEDGPVLDTEDVLKGDPAAPEWVREWSGPFSIHIARLAPEFRYPDPDKPDEAHPLRCECPLCERALGQGNEITNTNTNKEDFA